MPFSHPPYWHRPSAVLAAGPEFIVDATRTGRMTRCVVDDDANWFDEWRAERKRLNIGDKRFFWSPDDPAPASSCGLSAAEDRTFFRKEIAPRLRPCAQLKYGTAPLLPAADGSFSLSADMPANAVLFVELKVGEP